MTGPPESAILAQIERDLARTDPGLLALYDKLLRDNPGSERRPAALWRHPRLVLAYIITAVIVLVAIVSAIFATQAESCPHVPGPAKAAGCRQRPARCAPPAPSRSGALQCAGSRPD